VHYDVGRSASVVVLRQDGGLALRTNGLPEALMDSPGMPPRFSGEFWMSSLAVIANPAARDMLIVGFGGGVVVEGVPPSVQRIDVIELEPKVIEANRATRQLRKFDPLADPRVTVITNDARGALSLTEQALRRDRLATLASVDRGRLAPLHARVHAARARASRRRRRLRAVDERRVPRRGVCCARSPRR
jgi:hypothetical protein